MTGLTRNDGSKINQLLEHFPAVVILGARQVGKTTLAKQLRPNWHYWDLEKPSDHDRIINDPEFFFRQYPSQLILDEAQQLPLIFNILRGVIDQNRAEKGRFIITGSSSPELVKHISESLAGRVAVVELGTLKANEIHRQPLSPFYQLFEKPLARENLPVRDAPLSLQQIHQAWLYGGYPEPILENQTSVAWQWMESYYQTYINRDIAALFPNLNKIAYRQFIKMLGKLSGTIINRSTLARSLEVSEKSIREYLTIAEGTFLWRQLLSYENNVGKSLVKMPKGHVRDSGLLHYLLKIDSIEALYEHPILGFSFESFVIEEIIKGLQATSAVNYESRYYRTRNGAEIDLVIEGSFGVLPVEIKHGSRINFRRLSALNQFVEENQLPFGLLINQSEQATWLTPQIFQLPVGWL